MKPKFNVGDVVVVTNNGRTYSSYSDFVLQCAPWLVKQWRSGCAPDEGPPYIVMAVHKHFSRPSQDGFLYVICDSEYYVYVVGEDGLSDYKVPSRMGTLVCMAHRAIIQRCGEGEIKILGRR